MFDLSAVRAMPMAAARPPSDAADSVLAELAEREFRFATPGIPSVRLPRDRQSLENIWKMISNPQVEQAGAAWNSAVWTALTVPTTRVPLTPEQGADREFAAAAIVDPA